MNAGFLPPDDLPSASTAFDRILSLRLEEAIAKYFYSSCDAITQALLSKCQWHFRITADALTLNINCLERENYWNLLGAIEQLGHCVEEFASEQVIIRIFSPSSKGLPLEIQISEITAYRDWFEQRDS